MKYIITVNKKSKEANNQKEFVTMMRELLDGNFSPNTIENIISDAKDWLRSKDTPYEIAGTQYKNIKGTVILEVKKVDKILDNWKKLRYN